MKVLVTGGGGFLGSAICRLLQARGDAVLSVGRHRHAALEALGVPQAQVDIRELEPLRQASRGFDAVIHCAAKAGAWGSWDDYHAANVVGTGQVLEACRLNGIARLVYTSTPSVVHGGGDLEGVDESVPHATHFRAHYPHTKSIAERRVLAANGPGLSTVALRPHLIWGPGDPHLVPRLLARARAGRLRIVGDGTNRVDLVHVENAVDAHLAAERALLGPASPAAGRAYFITNGEPVVLWDWINALLSALGEAPVRRRISHPLARRAGALAELVWRGFGLAGEPPMTRFVADELAKDHWFSIAAARRDLGYAPRVTMAEGTAQLVAALRGAAAANDRAHGS